VAEEAEARIREALKPTEADWERRLRQAGEPVLSISLPEETYRRVEEVASAVGVSKSRLGREILTGQTSPVDVDRYWERIEEATKGGEAEWERSLREILKPVEVEYERRLREIASPSSSSSPYSYRAQGKQERKELAEKLATIRVIARGTRDDAEEVQSALKDEIPSRLYRLVERYPETENEVEGILVEVRDWAETASRLSSNVSRILEIAEDPGGAGSGGGTSPQKEELVRKLFVLFHAVEEQDWERLEEAKRKGLYEELERLAYPFYLEEEVRSLTKFADARAKEKFYWALCHVLFDLLRGSSPTGLRGTGSNQITEEEAMAKLYAISKMAEHLGTIARCVYDARRGYPAKDEALRAWREVGKWLEGIKELPIYEEVYSSYALLGKAIEDERWDEAMYNLERFMIRLSAHAEDPLPPRGTGLVMGTARTGLERGRGRSLSEEERMKRHYGAGQVRPGRWWDGD